MRKSKYDINKIQNDFDDGMSWSEVVKKYNISYSYLGKLVNKLLLHSNKNNKNQWKDGFIISDETIEKFKNLKLGKKLSQETKKKISNSLIKYLIENPDRVPYIINHSSKKSWPEEVFENGLKSSNIVGWKYKYRNGIYEYDFAFPSLKLDIEIDGGTHKTEKVRKIDERRDVFSINDGWKVLRFDSERVKKDVIGCIKELELYLYG